MIDCKRENWELLKGEFDEDDEEQGNLSMTPEQRIDFALLKLNSFAGKYDSSLDDNPVTEKMVNDPSLDIDVSKVSLEIVNNYEEDKPKEVKTEEKIEEVKSETVTSELETKKVQLSKW